jgi:hypothetical protein
LLAEGDPLEWLSATVDFEDFREALIRAGALDALFKRRDQVISDAGYLDSEIQQGPADD